MFLESFNLVDNKVWDGCLISGIQDFTHPVFKCPIRSLKNRNTTYFTDITIGGQRVNEVVTAVYCPTNSVGVVYGNGVSTTSEYDYIFNTDGPVFGPNGEYQLDPENNQCVNANGETFRLPVFGVCKNNCRGGNI